MTERFHFDFSLSCIGGGNGNPLQCSCLENPRDGGAWWAAVYGVAQSRTRLKQLSSSSSSRIFFRSRAQSSLVVQTVINPPVMQETQVPMSPSLAGVFFIPSAAWGAPQVFCISIQLSF